MGALLLRRHARSPRPRIRRITTTPTHPAARRDFFMPPTGPAPTASSPGQKSTAPGPNAGSHSRRRSHAKGPGAHAPRPFFCTHYQPQPAQAHAPSRRKKPVLAHPATRDKSQAPILRPSQRRFCAFCVIPRHRQQSQFRPFSHLPNTALRYPRRSYPDPRYSEAQLQRPGHLCN